MSSADIQAMFAARRDEVETYLDLVESIEVATQQGPPKIGQTGATISALQQKILYANVYLHLYNLVEATISQCVGALCSEAASDTRVANATDLAEPLLTEWVRFTARTSTDLGPEKRLEAALHLARQLIYQLPVGDFEIAAGGGGNWDDKSIEKIADRVGCQLTMTRRVKVAARRHVRDDLGPLGVVRDLRNRLAHGSMSFGECGASVTVGDLRSVSDAVLDYLGAVVTSFSVHLEQRLFVAGAGAST